MSTTTKQKVKTNFDYTQTWANRTIQGWKQAATEAKLVLEYPYDFPHDATSQLKRLRKLDAVATKGPVQKVITHMFRQNVHSIDSNGKPNVKECLTIRGQFKTTDFRGVPYSCEFEEGRYGKPNVIVNTNQKWNPDTGQLLESEKILSGQKLIYDIELPKEKAARKKFIDSIIEKAKGSYPDNIKFYYQELTVDNFAAKSDDTFSYEDFVNNSIEELRQMSERGGGSKILGYYRDKENKLRDRNDNLVSFSVQ